MSSSNDRVSLSDSGSERSRDSGSSRDDTSDREEMGSIRRIPMERVVEVMEDPPEELAKSNWPAKTGYEWVAADRDIVAPERVTTVECVCHGREGSAEEFFYMYMCHFSQLHIWLPFDEFTMGVLRLLNVAPTQLHPNSWAYLQAFRLLCMALYLEPSPRAFLYFFVTRPKSPITWLLLISRPGLNRLDVFTQSFKHLKDGFFKIVVISREDLSVVEKDVVDTLMQFSDKMPTKGLVRAVKARAAGNIKVPNLQDSLVDVHVHGGTKRKAELPTRPGKGKDMKKVRAVMMGAGSASGVKGPEAGLVELPETTVQKDIEINVLESLMDSIDNMEPKALVKALVEFSRPEAGSVSYTQRDVYKRQGRKLGQSLIHNETCIRDRAGSWVSLLYTTRRV
ncbi:Transposase putative [Vigna unguiculata]|uniref:Transposase putative n=1 Tax=Vigna unguiculata TaxID=3917 RepID=A0A4D6NBI9_VIGUN|nr:Transposase putative [Vigna unguiculata]